MKKYLIILLACQFLFSCNITFANEDSQIIVIVDNEQVQFDTQPIMLNDRVLVPFRAIAEALKVNVTWDETTNTVTSTKNDKIVNIQIDSNIALENGKEFELNVPAMIKDDRTFVPIRFFSEVFDADVTWDDSTLTVVINSNSTIVDNTNSADSLFTSKFADEDFSLLIDRLFIKMPDGTKPDDQARSIMAAKPSTERETIISSEKINNQMVSVYAMEMFNYSTGDLQNDAKIYCDSLNKKSKTKLKPSTIITGEGFDLIKIDVDNPTAENDISEDDNSFLIKGAIVRTSDNTLSFVGIYFNTAAFKSQKECLTLADSLISTIKCGSRKLNLSAHTEKISDYKISLEKDYVLTYDKGIDFFVYNIDKVVKIGEDPSYMGIYFGNWPSFSEEVDGFKEKDMKRISSTILGKKSEWLYYNNKTDLYMQTLVEIPGDEYEHYVHIFIYPANEDALNEMKIIAESLK